MIKNLWQKIGKKAATPSGNERSLCDVCDGESVNIVCLKGDAGDCQRLREMGFCESARVEKVAENGALICKICDSKVVVSEALAKNIIVGQCLNEGGAAMGSFSPKIILLSQLTVNQHGIIYDFVEESDACARLEEMGVTPGEAIEVVRFAPLGDPIEIKVRGYLLSLRREEADLIKVTVG